jgi:hypothetical protein
MARANDTLFMYIANVKEWKNTEGKIKRILSYSGNWILSYSGNWISKLFVIYRTYEYDKNRFWICIASYNIQYSTTAKK